MADIAKVGAPGSIAGFAEIIVSEEGTAAAARPSAPFSLSRLLERFTQLKQDLDPERLQMLLDMIESHTLDDAGAHGINPNIFPETALLALADLLFPGTVPTADPTIIVLAELAALDGTLTTTRTGTIWVTNAQGVLVSVAANTLAVDHGIDGTPLLPMWPERTNAFIRSNAVNALEDENDGTTSRLEAVGDATLAAGDGSLKAPDLSDDIVVCTAGDADAAHGARLAALGANASELIDNVASFFLHKLEADYVTIQLIDETEQLDLTTYTATINLVTGEVVDQGDGFSDVYVVRHPLSGWWRLGVQYHVAGSADIGLDVLGHTAAETPIYQGASEELFAIAHLSNTYGAGLAPFVATAGATASSGATTLTFDGADRLPIDQAMFLLEWYGYHNTSQSPGLLFGDTLLKLDDTTLLELGPTGLQEEAGSTGYLNDHDNAHVISLDTTKTVRKTRGSAKTTALEPLMPLTGDHLLTMGPAPGYLRTLLGYPVADTASAVNYLVGEAE